MASEKGGGVCVGEEGEGRLPAPKPSPFFFHLPFFALIWFSRCSHLAKHLEQAKLVTMQILSGNNSSIYLALSYNTNVMLIKVSIASLDINSMIFVEPS